jgi:antirestriction protein ArdC
MQSPNEIRQQITSQIVEALTNGNLPPWRRPWTNDPNGGLNTSLSTGNPYRGINQLLLQVSAGRSGFQSRWWGTFNQIKASGGSDSRSGCLIASRRATWPLLSADPSGFCVGN